jgi:hypothetical protein
VEALFLHPRILEVQEDSEGADEDGDAGQHPPEQWSEGVGLAGE